MVSWGWGLGFPLQGFLGLGLPEGLPSALGGGTWGWTARAPGVPGLGLGSAGWGLAWA